MLIYKYLYLGFKSLQNYTFLLLFFLKCGRRYTFDIKTKFIIFSSQDIFLNVCSEMAFYGNLYPLDQIFCFYIIHNSVLHNFAQTRDILLFTK